MGRGQSLPRRKTQHHQRETGDPIQLCWTDPCIAGTQFVVQFFAMRDALLDALLVLHDRGDRVHPLNIRMTGQGGARVDLTNPNGEPTVLLLLNRDAVHCPEIVLMVRDQRATLSPTVNLLVICPQVIPCLESGEGYIVAVSKDVAVIARALGVRNLPGMALLDSAGGVLWTSDAMPKAGSNQQNEHLSSDRTSGAVGLGDIDG